MAKIEEIGKVYQTKDYDYFKKLDGNRIVEKYSSLKEQIEKQGQICPIVINGFQEVIDGQHRLAILKELNRPVKFVVNENAGFGDAISMNSAQKNWKPEDFVNAYAEKGNEDYKLIRAFKDTHPNWSIKLIVCAAAGYRVGNYHNYIQPRLKKGELKASNYRMLQDFAKFYESVLDETLLKDSSKLQSILWTMFTVKNFDGDRFIKKVNQVGNAKEVNLYKFEKEILSELVTTYNANIKPDNPKYLENFYDGKKSLQLPDKNMIRMENGG